MIGYNLSCDVKISAPQAPPNSMKMVIFHFMAFFRVPNVNVWIMIFRILQNEKIFFGPITVKRALLKLYPACWFS
jgi:hypothetical protein